MRWQAKFSSRSERAIEVGPKSCSCLLMRGPGCDVMGKDWCFQLPGDWIKIFCVHYLVAFAAPGAFVAVLHEVTVYVVKIMHGGDGVMDDFFFYGFCDLFEAVWIALPPGKQWRQVVAL